MNYDIQTNYTNVCRTCLVENSNMKCVFTCEEVLDQKIMLCDMLMSCASVLIIQGDGLPENICYNCFQQINTAYLFRKLCERSDVTLRDYTASPALSNQHSNIVTIPENGNKFKSDIQAKTVNKENCLNSGGDNQDTKYFDTEKLLNKVICLNSESNYEDYIQNGKHQEKDSSFENRDFLEDTVVEESIVKQLEETVDKNRKYTCRKCNSIFGLLSSFRAHVTKVHAEVFRCEQCGQKFNTKNMLTRHLVSSHKNNSTEPKRQRNKSGVIKKRNLPRTCDICNKTFRFHSNLERHKLIHTGEKPYLCNVCGKGFAQMAYLKIHAFIHTGEKPYKCQMCERSFAAPGTLMTHVRTHTGECPHICKICGKDFPQSGYLSAHIRTHTGEKPVECKVCNQRFNQSGRLIIHMRIHSGEKPYQCKDCGRSFAVKGTLKKHIRTHTGERPYMCKVCGQTFAQSGTLTTHMKVHKAKVEGDNVMS